MSAVLAEAPRRDVSTEFASLFSHWQRLEQFEETILKLLPFAKDEEIQETKRYAHEMGNAGWRIVCACDSVLLSRAMQLKGGRGNVDIDGIGKLGVAKKEAARREINDRSVRRNAQIHKLVKSMVNVHHTLLDDKGYFEAALRAPNAKKAVKLFEKEKSENPNFSVRDALRLAKQLKDHRTPVSIAGNPDYISPDLKKFLIEVETALTGLRDRCPRPEFTIRLDSWIRATRFERTRTPQSDYESVRKQVDQGACTMEEVAEEVYLSLIEIKGIFNQIIDKEPSSYEWRPIGANTEEARGSRSRGIFRTDAPAGDDFDMPHNQYEPMVEYDDE